MDSIDRAIVDQLRRDSHLAVADLATYERFLSEELMALPHLGRLESRFAMKTVKTDLQP
ncbi:Lrp/AsnC ligand binding domain-containing protein [Ammonicoccus fulvus]|uniref:Lrp/AsnC ligand binding domain-containing protein n=1 Tax=Ammonicoccus fulvus TaxID=3138240 RepID=A0ABZ3FVA1_9ACTN